MPRPFVMREGSDIVSIHCYAPGDGKLCFVARYTEDNPNGKRSQACSPSPTREECEKVLPDGWELYEEGPYFRARRILTQQPVLFRSIKRWQGCDPRAMATAQGPAAIEFAFIDAKHDVLMLADALKALLDAMDDGSDEPVLVSARALLATT